MRRRDLLKKLRQIAAAKGLPFEFVREGGSHTVYRLGDQIVPIPRHAEINQMTATSIIREAESLR